MEWPGSRWWKFDLHVHTPASHDYRGDRGPEGCKALIRAALLAGVSGLAITDHNTPAGIEPMQQALIALRETMPENDPLAALLPAFALFPGAEVTCASGTHMLAVFPPGSPRDQVSILLNDCGIRPVRYGDKDAQAKCSEQEFCECAARQGALAIAAHVDAHRGALKLQDGQPQIHLFNHPDLSALEIHNGPVTLPTEVRRRHAFVSGSDAHCPEDVCPRFTWLRMTEPSFEGLRLALQDPDQALSSLTVPKDPNLRHAGSFIESVSVSRTRYMGQPDPWRMVFSPWLNTIIGHRGSGKSTLVALMRTVLRRDKNLPEPVQREQNLIVSQPEGRGDKGVLTPQTSVDLLYNKDGLQYRIHWDPAAAASGIAVRTSAGQWEGVPGDVRDQFPARIFSQNELFALADDPAALLRIVDEAPEVGRAQWDADWRLARDRVLDIRRALRRTAELQPEVDRLSGQLDELRRRLALLETPDNRRILETYERVHRQRAEMESRAQEMDELAAGLERTAAALQWPDVPPDLFLPEDATDAEVMVVLAEAGRTVTDASTGVAHAAERLRSGAERLRAILAASHWASRAEAARTAYEELRRQASADTSTPADYATLLQQRHEIERRMAAVQEEISTRGRLQAESEAAQQSLLALRGRLSSQRQAFVDRVLRHNPLVRIHVEPMGDVAPYGEEFWQRFGITRFEDTRQAAARDLIAAATVQARVQAIRSLVAGMEEAVAAGSNPWTQEKRFTAAAKRAGAEALDEAAVSLPEDLLQVSYRKTPGESFQLLQVGSPGQKSAALLAFFLSYGSEPLILDQPENDLDNELVSTLVVEQLKALKPRRQLIIVTHNANIVVNGDAEAVFSFEARGGQTRVPPEHSGGLDEPGVRDAVCRILEGGRAAFEARYRRIAANK